MPRARYRIAAPEFEPEPLPLELPLVDPTRLPALHDEEDPASDAGDDRPRVIVIDLC
jgi:hypothetical protein